MICQALNKFDVEAPENRLPPVIRDQLGEPDLDDLVLGRAADIDVVVEILQVRYLVAEDVVDRRNQLEIFVLEEDDQHCAEHSGEQKVCLFEAASTAVTF